jgi:isoleucyl-tRNA synthetase
VSKVQNLRKESGLEVVDRINLSIKGDAAVVAAANGFAEYIKNEVLAIDLIVAEGCGDIDLNGHKAELALSKA